MSKTQEIAYNVAQGVGRDGHSLLLGGTVMVVGAIATTVAAATSDLSVGTIGRNVAEISSLFMYAGSVSFLTGIVADHVSDELADRVNSVASHQEPLLSPKEEKKYQNIATSLLLGFSLAVGMGVSLKMKSLYDHKSSNNTTVQSAPIATPQ